MLLKKNIEGKRIFNELVEREDFREIIKDKEQFLLIDKNGAIIAECSIKMTEWLEEKKIVELEWI